MKLHTVPEVITFVKNLENDSARFFEEIARQYTVDAEALLSFARDNRKNISQIERAYYSSVTDAIEGGYAFDLDPKEYALELAVPQGKGYADILKQAIDNEGKIIAFYHAAARQSESLISEVQQAFRIVVKRKVSNKVKLEEILSQY